jgi:hypothetical protein
MVTSARFERLRRVLCLATAALTHGCFLSADAEFPEVDVVRNLNFDGVPANVGESVLTKSYDVVYKDLNLPKEMRSEFHPTDAVLVAADGASDLSFIRKLTLTRNPEAGDDSASEEIVVDYERPGGTDVGSELHVPCNESVDISRSGAEKTVFTLRMTGVMPDHPWSAGLTVRLHGHVRFKP